MARFNYDIRRRKLNEMAVRAAGFQMKLVQAHADIEHLQVLLGRAKYERDVCRQQLMDAQRGIAIYNQWRKQTGPWRG